MPYITYILTTKNSSTEYEFEIEDSIDNPEGHIYRILLDKLREKRLYKILREYKGDFNDRKELEEYLPHCYKEYANNLALLKENMASLYEIVNKIRIKVKSRECYGCVNDRPGQRDHMGCDGGCLHDPFTCLYC